MNLADEIAALARRTVPELRERYAALFGEGTTAKHKTWLVKRIAWRLQAVAEGELSERARQRGRRRRGERAVFPGIAWRCRRRRGNCPDPVSHRVVRCAASHPFGRTRHGR